MVYTRVKAKAEMPPLDATRYMLNPPAQARRNDVGEWKRSLDNASAQLEHQYLRILNLELLLKYGDKVRQVWAWATLPHALMRHASALQARRQSVSCFTSQQNPNVPWQPLGLYAESTGDFA